MAGETLPTPRGSDGGSLRTWALALVTALTRLLANSIRGESFTVATLPPAEDERYGSGAIIFVSDEIGGAVLAYSDGIDWRRVTDRAVVS